MHRDASRITILNKKYQTRFSTEKKSNHIWLLYYIVSSQSDFSSYFPIVSHHLDKYNTRNLHRFFSFFPLTLYIYIWFDIDSNNNSDTFGITYVRPIQPDIMTHTDSTYRFQASYSSIHHEPSNNNPLGKKVLDHSLKCEIIIFSQNIEESGHGSWKSLKKKNHDHHPPLQNTKFSFQRKLLFKTRAEDSRVGCVTRPSLPFQGGRGERIIILRAFSTDPPPG